MSRVLRVAESTAPRRTKPAAAAVEEAVGGEGFDVARFVENFDVIAEAAGGVANLRQLALQLAFQGRFTGRGRPLVPAKVHGTHAVLRPSKGREATSVVVPGGAALAVGPAEMLIPEGWDWVPLVSVASLESGHTPSRNHPDYWDGGIPWIGIRDAKAHNYGWIDSTEQTVSKLGLANSSTRLLPAGTVCLSRTASVGYVTIMKRPMCTSQDFVNWVCGDRLMPEFLMQLLRCEVPVLRRFAKGAVHQTIYFPEVKAFHVSLPPLAEQKRIVAKVDQLMALCDELEARQTKKRETSARLTKSALEALTTAEGPTEFDAAWKRVVENFDVLIDRAEKVGELRLTIMDLASKGRLVRPQPSDGSADAMVSAKRREIEACLGAVELPVERGSTPPGWRWELLGNLGADPENPVQTGPFGAQLHRSDFVSDGVPVIAVGNLTGTGFTTDGLYFVSRPKAESLARYDVNAGDLLFARSGATTGKVCVAPKFVHNWRMTGHILRVRLDPRVISSELVAIWLWGADLVRSQVMGNIRGGTRPGYNTGLLKSIVVPVPPLAEQQRIVARVEALMAICDDLESSLLRAASKASKAAEATLLSVAEN